ncbi:beta-propeller domain-containing protein [Psychrobium sp. nBUS_13]|uniref:beta-propeller domain-containing protein n=1 Tax=Psychrobium sp. nBUS_13 TaxID=3395319 RepID=UPI003EC07451
MKLSSIASVTLLATSITLIGCGGSETATTMPAQKLPMKSSTVTPYGALTLQGDNALGTRLRNGVFLAHTTPLNTVYTAKTSETADSNFSRAITQEAGVDESDRFHFNGQQLFLTINNRFNYTSDNNEQGDVLRILQRQTDNSLQKLSDTTLVIGDEKQHINGMYVSGNRVSLLSSNAQHSWPIAYDLFYPLEQQFSISIYDAQNLTLPSLKQQYTIDGHVLSSRQIDNKLYVISSFSPSINHVVDADVLNKENEVVFEALRTAPLSGFLPHVTDIAGNQTSLVSSYSCYIPAQFDENSGHHGLVLMTVIDTEKPTDIKSQCVNTQAQGIYVSKDAVYLYGEQYQDNITDLQSVIYKFAISDEGLSYRAYATLDGHFGFRNSQFRFNESGNYLTTVSTTYDENYAPTHQLSVFKDQGDDVLTAVGHLPNQAHPAPIGKPNEDIYAVRYFNNKAYIVTFERTDPLYVIDLSNKEEPTLEGALEIPGYSAYLHPVNQELLLGVGQHILAQDDDSDLPVIDEGAQVSLFDVGEPQSPVQLSNHIYKDSFTPVEFDHHALSYLQLSAYSHRIALPTEQWVASISMDTTSQLTSTLQLLEINGEGSSAILESVGKIEFKKDINSSYFSSIDARSILTAQGVYYIHGNDVLYRDWQEGSDTIGPF